MITKDNVRNIIENYDLVLDLNKCTNIKKSSFNYLEGMALYICHKNLGLSTFQLFRQLRKLNRNLN